jgi:hypothetical protein
MEGQIHVFISLGTGSQLYTQSFGSTELLALGIYPQYGPHRNNSPISLLLLRVLSLSAKQELFPSNGRCTLSCVHRCYLAMGLSVTVCLFLFLFAVGRYMYIYFAFIFTVMVTLGH